LGHGSIHPRQVHVVPHTHWDREWYKPYPVFRMQLVELLDGLLPQLEADETYAHFQLDGQLAVVDDYLEIRPDERERLGRLNRAGRISMGPWYTLPDEFLVSGETHVRNLRLGIATAEAFGGAMAVGYLPDMFGHVAQMPQILAGFGLADAVVWRGVPAAIDAPAFWWEDPTAPRCGPSTCPTATATALDCPSTARS
jgi:mannosylglycerate hydrolase